jgi:pyruvate, water dikinase
MKEEIDFVKWFSELNKDSGSVAGGKGANLAEIYNLKIPVPAGFVVTAQSYDYFLKKADLREKINEILKGLDYEDTEKLNQATKEVRDLILKAKVPKEMEEEIIENYEILDVDDSKKSKGSKSALDILKNSAEPIFVAVRSSATAEDLADASFAGQQDSFVNIKGNTELILHIKKCFASLFTARATYYRNKKGFEHDKVSLAVVVQKMVDSDKSGVMFSKDPAHKNDNTIIEAVWGLGEGIVSGAITPDKYVVSSDMEITDKKIANKKIAITRDSGGNKEVVKLREEKSKHQVLKNYEITKLAEMAQKLEDHYKKPQDIEFAIEGEEISIVQTRPITTIDGRVEKRGEEIKGEAILQGLGASPGIASGKIKIIKDLADLKKIIKGDVLVTTMTNPDMVVSMQKSAAIVTDEGGLTAHAAIVSREMGIPAVVGTQEATTKLKEGEIITVDGSSGKVYKGKVAETQKKEVLPVTAETKTKLKVIVDLPSFAERASKSKIQKVGLTRVEGIIAESGKHPLYFLKRKEIQDYEEIIFKGIHDIAEYFDEMWIRTSDIRTDEFQNLEGAPKEIEANPMLGMHGIRFGIKHPEILKAELRAMKRVAQKGKKMGILMPQVISLEDLQTVKKFLKEIEFNDAKVGIMIETPAAVQLIKDFCEDGIDFISFGTNDLTQYMLAVDRGNEEVQHLFNELNPAVLYQLGFVIRVCKRYNVETSICGQAGSKKEMVKFLVEKGIDSISVNADMAKEISDYIAEIEKGLVEGTDQEPRKYKPETNQEQAQNNKEKTNNDFGQVDRTLAEKKETNQEFEKPQEPLREETQKPIEENKYSVPVNSEQVAESKEYVTDTNQAIEKIEEEKQEYLNHETEPENIPEQKPIQEESTQEESTVVPGFEEPTQEPPREEEPKTNSQEYVTDTNEAVEKIEEEKQEYLQEQDSNYKDEISPEKEDDDEDQVLDIF